MIISKNENEELYDILFLGDTVVISALFLKEFTISVKGKYKGIPISYLGYYMLFVNDSLKEKFLDFLEEKCVKIPLEIRTKILKNNL